MLGNPNYRYLHFFRSLCSSLLALGKWLLPRGSWLLALGSWLLALRLVAPGCSLDTDFWIPAHIVYIVYLYMLYMLCILVYLSIFLKVAAQRNTYFIPQTKLQLRRGSYLFSIELPLSVSICRRRLCT